MTTRDRLPTWTGRYGGHSTPLSVFDLDRVADNVRVASEAVGAFGRITYSLKACYLAPVVRAVRAAGAGANVFSETEALLAEEGGFDPADVVFNGVGRSGPVLARALEQGASVNLESGAELAALAATWDGRRQRGALGLRLRVDREHSGGPEKYGVLGMSTAEAAAAVERARAVGLRVSGLAFHAFANRESESEHMEHLAALRDVLGRIEAAAGPLRLEHVDVGGGFASRADMGPGAARAFERIAGYVQREFGAPTVFELGRFIVGDAETVITTVVDVRATREARYVIVDATTNYLIPAPGHRFRAVPFESDGGPGGPVVVVDRLGSEICRGELGRVLPGQRLAVVNCGAYAGVMRERFVYPLPRTVFVSGGAEVGSAPGGSDEDVAAFHLWRTPLEEDR